MSGVFEMENCELAVVAIDSKHNIVIIYLFTIKLVFISVKFILIKIVL